MTGVPLGIALGALNVIVIGIAMAFAADEADVAIWVAMFGIVPGLIAGALVGWLADLMKPLPSWVRTIMLIVPAVLVVIFLGMTFAMPHFIAVSCIPTAVAALLLERGTRRAITPRVPVARVVDQQPAPPTLRQLS
jgi:hypothetical protein